MNKRVEEIDIVKALGIILMVIGHSSSPFTKFIYLFHMPIFFIASGFLYNEKNSKSFSDIKNYIKNKFRSLWFPYALWNSIFVLFNNIFIQLNIYTNNPLLLEYANGTHVMLHDKLSFLEMVIDIIKSLLFVGSTEMGGALWFLRVLFVLSILYCLMDFIMSKIFRKQKICIHFIISVVFLFIGYQCGIHNINLYGLGQVFSFYILFYIGHILNRVKSVYAEWDYKRFMPILLCSYLALFMLSQNIGEGFEPGANSYKSPQLLLICSVFGWMLLYSASNIIKQFKSIKKLLILIGQDTISIVILHFLCFKVVSVCISHIYNLPSFCIATFPNLYGSIGGWWVAYTVVGVCLPVVLYEGYKGIKNYIYRKIPFHNI